VSKDALEKKVAGLAGMTTAAELAKALRDRNNYYVSKAAKRAAELGLRESIPELLEAFERFTRDPVKTDKQCWAKNEIAKALKEFQHDDAAWFARGMKIVQMEPVWGGSADTAQDLRSTCMFGLIQCSMARSEAMKHLVDALGSDKEKMVRANAALAMAQLGGIEAVLLLRLKALDGDKEPEVIGQCFAGLLALDAAGYVAFVAEFLDGEGDERFEAAAALGELPDERAVTALKNRFEHSDRALKRAILLSLGASRVEAARGFLLGILGDTRTSANATNWEVAQASIAKLGLTAR
ncbi:MAG TPA: HEAT repeat domain-containing protein, partial [Bryobacteraceae bacterium]|nr:HEAT repeat domain-containing protein [Bryobacteraceae bacterium]